ncbi:MAG: helix-turn-helix domain-containing protein [Candidatus Diapherotrites archaeon]|nr:helix-turn-helix domain-containing protein [Candidatus Diapherotrites archaeon]
MDTRALREIGLTEIEATVYVTLLGLDGSGAGEIIKKTGLHKATVYSVLQQLIEKGVVSYILLGKERFFRAESPDVFLDMLEYKKQKLNEILPELRQKIGTEKKEQEATIYSGTKGIKTVCESALGELRPAGEYVDFGVSGLFKETMGAYWFQWQKKKRAYKIGSKCIFDESVRGNKELLQNYFGAKKFVAKQFYSPVDTMVYNDKVVLFIWNARPPLAVKIKSTDVAEAYRNQFKLLWKIAKK